MDIPGFVDLQVNGYMGIDFSSPKLTEESCYIAIKKVLETGTIIFLPTVITSSMEVYRKNLGVLAKVITDGHHLNPSILKTIIRAKGVDKICITSDASPVAGMPPGKYHTLGNNAVLKKSGRLYNPDTGYLVGSSSMMIDCVN